MKALLVIAVSVFPLLTQELSEKERALGAQVASEIRGQSTPVSNRTVNDYVQRTGRRLELVLNNRKLNCQYEVLIADASEPMSMIGRYIMVPASFFLAVRDEDEFAVMLAHSIAHITMNHGRNQLGGTNAPLIYMGGWTGLHAGAGEPFLTPRSYLETQRRNELEADRLGMELAARAGYDPASLRRYLQRTPSSWREERLTGLDDFLGTAQPVASVSSSDFLQARLEAESASLTARQDHRPTLRRLR